MDEVLKIKFSNTLYHIPNRNSSLKKKLSLLNKLKNIDSTYQSVIDEFTPEEMSKFLPEISTNILYNLNEKNIVYILHVINYFKIYNAFLEGFVIILQGSIKANINGNVHLYVILYYELSNYFIEGKGLQKIVNKMNTNEVVKLFVYLSKDIACKKMIIDYCIENKDKLDEHFDEVAFIFNRYEEAVALRENFLERNFVKVIEPYENEFEFYEAKEPVDTEFDLEYLYENIIHFNDKPQMIDAIARKVCDEKLVAKDVLKIIGKSAFTLVLTRLIVNFDIMPKLVPYFETNDTSLPFLCELSKYRKYPYKNIIKVLEDCIKAKKVSTIICILNQCARFYLHRTDTNHLIRRSLEKINTMKNELSGCARIEISNCLSKIFYRQDINIIDDYFLNCDLNKLDNNVIIVLAMKPWIFENDRLVNVVESKKLVCVPKITEENVFICLMSEKLTYALRYAKFYSKFGYNTNFVQKVMVCAVTNSSKAYILMAYIENIEKLCVDEIEMLVENCNIEIRNYWANFKAKHGIKDDFDDFENEMKKLASI